uniref:Kazal-like domain-containing protein n=1 Tax=Balaenoptera musculus TaxID=9771 RepID=A0A8C0C6M5_BALMU
MFLKNTKNNIGVAKIYQYIFMNKKYFIQKVYYLKIFMLSLHFCTREMDPICATNGRTYSNKCVFCSEKENSGKFDFSHWGCC